MVLEVVTLEIHLVPMEEEPVLADAGQPELGREADRARRADLDAEAAKGAAVELPIELLRPHELGAFLPLPFDIEAVRAAGPLAELTGDTERLPLLVAIEPREPPESRRRHLNLLGVFDRDLSAEVEAERHGQPAQDVDQEERLEEPPKPSHRRNLTRATTRKLASAKGMSHFQT